MDDEQRMEGHILELKFNSGESLAIRQNDIVVFVGPNNAGKSQCLKDIYFIREEDKDGRGIRY